MEYLRFHKDVATVEITPQHLTLAAPEAYERLGAYAQMNPPIRDASHQPGLWRGITMGVADVMGSDHAPHTREEKARPYPASPSGMPGVQTLVPIMLTHVANGRLTLERFVDLTSHGPQRVFGLADKGRVAEGYDADLTIVDLKARRTITHGQMATTHGGMSETFPNSYRQMSTACGCMSQTAPEALCEMASSQAGSLSDRSEAFACSLCESTEPSTHA
jgi:dihydroorotase